MHVRQNMGKRGRLSEGLTTNTVVGARSLFNEKIDWLVKWLTVRSSGINRCPSV